MSPVFRRTGPQRLSFAQEGLWFVDRLRPNSPLYNIPQALRLKGPLAVAALTGAFERIIQRHETLRCQIVCMGEQPIQTIRTEWSFQILRIDLRQASLPERELKLKAHLNEEARLPFDLADELPIRARLLQLADDEHVLALSIHHIAADMWSLELFYRELETCYEAIVNRTEAWPEELPVQYLDFAIQERQRVQGGAGRAQVDYWKRQLSGELPVLEMATDKTRPAKRSFEGCREQVQFSPELLTCLKQLSRQEGTTVYVTLLAAFGVLLGRYSSQDQLFIGSPIGIRGKREIETLIGVFLNTVVLKADLSGEPSFRTVLKRVHTTVVEALAHREVPLERIVEALKIERIPGHNPLFQVFFQYLPALPLLPRLPGLKASPLPMESGTAKFDLTLTLAESGRNLAGDLEYSTDLFTRSTIRRLLEHFNILLGAIISHPDQSITRLRLMEDAEAKQILVDWNATKTLYPREASIADLFEEQVKATPLAPAIIFGNERLNYSELNAGGNLIASLIRQSEMKPAMRVGICLERSLELVFSVLGAVKAGAAYVPLDPDYPAERIAYMIEDSGIAVVITSMALRAKHFSNYTGRVICLDKNWGACEELAGNPDRAGDDVAYVMYTSGSTGQPKGVAIPHRGVIRLVKETNYIRPCPDHVFLLFAPISFDASTFELWAPLLNGASLVIFPPRLESLHQFGKVIQEFGVNVLWLTAGLFHEILEHDTSFLRGLKILLAGGDVLSVPCVKKALRELPDTEIINGYGPTENTTFTCCYSVPRTFDGQSSLPIGKPISNTQVYILDQHLQPVPIGVKGELFIGGDGLAREYLNREELNREKFIAHPFLAQPGSRLYRTGDIARWLPDGNIEFFGRQDRQVKIRGFRVELTEVEGALRLHPGIQEVAVTTPSSPSGTKSLVAYLEVRAESKPEAAELKIFLQGHLPAHAIPEKFVFLERLPLSANGKIDYRLLPAPETTVSKTFLPPSDLVEEKLSTIWEQVLKRERISTDEHFFHLGGHSILAMGVVMRINHAFGTNVALNEIFEHPTIAQLAKVVRQHQGMPSMVPPIVERARRRHLETHPKAAERPTIKKASI